MSQLTVRGVPFWYDRTSHAAYGTFGGFPQTAHRQDRPELYAAVGRWLEEMAQLGLPIAEVATAGTYVNKPGPHGRGIAIDLDAIKFRDERVLVTRDGWRERSDLYFVCDAILRFHFTTVIDGFYEPFDRGAHRDHYHVDLVPRGGLFRAHHTTVVFLQASLSKLGHDCGAIDGDCGPKTAAAYNAWAAANGERERPQSRWTAMAEAIARWWRKEGIKRVLSGEPTIEQWVRDRGISDGTRGNEPATRREVWLMLQRLDDPNQ